MHHLILTFVFVKGKSLLLKEGCIREAQALESKTMNSESNQEFHSQYRHVVLYTVFPRSAVFGSKERETKSLVCCERRVPKYEIFPLYDVTLYFAPSSRFMCLEL